MSEYEQILTELRPFGPYQIRVFVLVSMFETPLAWAMLLPIFTSAKPSWSCQLETLIETVHVTLNTSSSNTTNNTHNCLPDGIPCPGIVFSDEFTSVLSEFQLVCGRDYIPDLITSLQMAGVLIGALVTGQLGDLLGRTRLLFVEYILLLCVSFASAFSNSWELYAGLRFIIGALVGGCLVVNFVLPLEFVTPAWRTFCGCIGFWAVGLMTLALYAFLLRDWRHLTMATSASGIFMLLSWWFIPESPRWLLSKGRLKEAEVILTSMANTNRRPVPNFSGLKQFVEKEHNNRVLAKKYSYWHLFSSYRLGCGTLILMYGWFVSSAVYYGLNFNSKNLSGDRYFNVFLSGLVEIPALVFVVLVNNCLGRRWTTAILMLLAGSFCFSILVLDLAKVKMSGLTLALSLVGKSGIAGGWAAVQVFSAETFPTVIRNIGIGACSMAARLGGIVAPQIVFLGSVYKPVPFAVFGALSLLCGILVLLLTETTNVPLPDQLCIPVLPRKESEQKPQLVKDIPLAERNGQCGQTHSELA